MILAQQGREIRGPDILRTWKNPGRRTFRVVFVSEIINYRYLAVLTLTPGPMVEATVQERIY